MPRYGIGALSVIDNRDDRREIFYLLSQLSPGERLQFLSFVIRILNQAILHTHEPPYTLITVRSDTGTVNETYYDLMLAISQYHIPIPPIVERLEQFVIAVGKFPTQEQRVRHEKNFPLSQNQFDEISRPEQAVQRLLQT